MTTPAEPETALLHALTTLNRRPGVARSDGAEPTDALRAEYVAALTRRYRLLELSTLLPDGAEKQPVSSHLARRHDPRPARRPRCG